jgi:predicted O-methyltransferase YrrM
MSTRALDVLPRLADGMYDMLVVDGEPVEHAGGVAAGLRLLRPGGILVVHGVLVGGRIADPAARDPQTVALREIVKQLRDAEEWTPALIPAGSGMLTAVRR